MNLRHKALIFSACAAGLLFYGTETYAQTPGFNEENAWKQLLTQCDFGPRPPGSRAHQQCLEYLETELQQYASSVQRQDFFGLNPVSNESLPLVNLIARFFPERSRRLLLCAHWDTRPWADQDPDPKNHQTPIIGANDGASGVAVLLEIGRCLKLRDPGIGVDIVLFDGEDMGRASHPEEYCLGSRWYADHLTMPLPEAAVLLDMIGDADLLIPYELYSYFSARNLQQEIYHLAAELGEKSFLPSPGPSVYDDHVPLIQEGIPAVDLIDFDYEYWHTIEDTPKQCSPSSLGSVGRVLLEWIYRRGSP